MFSESGSEWFKSLFGIHWLNNIGGLCYDETRV
jgi:hypothetical protein